MDGSGPKFFSRIDSVLSIVLAASLLAAGPRALAETGAIMIAIGQMKLGSVPTGFTFARTGKGGEAEWTVTEDQTASQWHTLRLRAEGERFTVSYDGKMLFGMIDKTFAEAGGVALWTKADSVTRFDAMTITTLP